jgi:hypothetical protein
LRATATSPARKQNCFEFRVDVLSRRVGRILWGPRVVVTLMMLVSLS